MSPTKYGDQVDDEKQQEPRWVESWMAFANPAYVFPDPHRGGVGNRLVLPRAPGADKKKWSLRRVRINDLARHRGRTPNDFEPDLFENGFAIARIDAVLGLQAALQEIADRDHMGLSDISALERAVHRTPIPLGAEHMLEVLDVDTKSLFMRKSGPDGMSLEATGRKEVDFKESGRTLAAAVDVHTDGDADGDRTSRQFKRNFHHAGNPSSEMFTLTLWIALQQPVRPLAVMDCRTLDREHEQVKQAFELPPRTNGEYLHILEPQEPTTVENHMLLHRCTQEWYFKSDLGPGQALVFDTMSTPHGTFLLPGESELGQLYRQLERAQAVLTENGPHAQVSIGALTFALWPDSQRPSQFCPEAEAAPAAMRLALPVRHLLQEMDDLVREGRQRVAALCRASSSQERQGHARTERLDYLERVASALRRCSRKSVEIRCSAIVRRTGWLGRPLDIFAAQLRLPPVFDQLGIIDSLAEFKIPGLQVHAWVVVLAVYLLCAVVLFLDYRYFRIS